MYGAQTDLPPTLNIRNQEIPEPFRRAARGDLSALGKHTEFTLDGGGHALLYPDRSDESALALTKYRAAVVTMNNQRYPRAGLVGMNEKGRSMALFPLEGEFTVTVNGQPISIKPGRSVATRDGQKVSISGTGKMFILADGGETNEYPE